MADASDASPADLGPMRLCAIFDHVDAAVCGHVHDEVIVECREGTAVEEITDIMEQTPDWMPGLLLRADGYETRWYMKM